MKFLFDMDGTLTRQETLPLIASHFGITAQIETLTRHTVNGDIPFMESFIKRVEILRKLPVSTICSLLENIPVFEQLLEFIKAHRDDCALVTGNLDVWVEAIAKKVGCKVYRWCLKNSSGREPAYSCWGAVEAPTCRVGN